MGNKRRVLLGTVEVYGWEDENGMLVRDVADLHGHRLWIQGEPVVLVTESTEEPALARILESTLV